MPQETITIVAQNLLRLLQQPQARLVTLALVLPFAGIVAAFGTAPDTATDQLVRTKVVEDIALHLTTPVENTAESYWREERIQRGDTLASLLARLQVDDPAAMDFLRNTRETRSLFQLVPGRALRAQTDADGKLLGLRYLNGSTLLRVTREGNTPAGELRVEERAAELETRTVTAAGQIRSSLFAATDTLNIPDSVATQMVEIFSTDIDFHRDLRKDDRFSVVYEMLYDRGEPVRAGRLLSAEFVNQGKSYSAIWFAAREGEGTYYTLDGKNIRKAFLRSPLEFSRITSGFTPARFHPILQTWRAHTGVDYAAAIGTRIKATADGVVDFAGVQSGYGNVVILRHQSKYTTLYGHMSGFASGIRKGTRVQQGDVIGYVGMTGMTTGPHVHYEFRIDGVYHNPLSVAMPVAFPIAPEQKRQFEAVAAPMSTTFALLRGSTPAPSQFE